MAILALDQGTSGSKAIVVGEEGIHAVCEQPLTPHYLPNGGVEQDPWALMDSILSVGERAVSNAKEPIEAVCLANQGESVLAWDPATGDPLSPIIVWQDSRAASVCRRLEDRRDEIQDRTGLVLDPYFTAPKVTWLRDNVTGDGIVTTTDAWIIHRLTGDLVTDSSTASRSLLMNLDGVDWDPDLCKLFGVPQEELPRIVASDEIAGTTTAFGGEVPVAGLIVDQQAALLAESCLTAGDAKCTYGTGAFLLANVGQTAVRMDNGLTTSVAWTLRGETTYCVDAQVYTAASGVRWLTRLGLLPSPEDIDRCAADSSEGVVFSPALAGLAAPWWNTHSGGTIAGLRLSTEPGHLIRALMEGIAAHVAEVSEIITHAVGREMRVLRVDGGLTRSRTLMQAQADMLQCGIDVYPSAHATPMGAAVAARLALNPSMDVPEAVFQWEASHTYRPQRDTRDVSSFRKRWRATVEAQLRVDEAHDGEPNESQEH